MDWSSDVSREIMWNIPLWMKVGMYVCLALATASFLWGLQQKFLFVTAGKGWSEAKKLLPTKLNCSQFFQTLFFQGKVTRSKDVALYHTLIYWGFVTLFIATEFVAIHYDTPFKIFQGPLYLIVSLIADVGGVALLIGLALAYHRRYIKKPDYLAATHPKQELGMYLMLFLLVFVGYLLEGIRLIGAGMPEIEKTFAPFGWLMAQTLMILPLSDEMWAMSYRGLWFFHMVNTMVFIGGLTHTKFFHILALPLAALLTPARRGAVLNPMDFNNENAETFGLGKLSELTVKERFDTLTCVECGRCTQVCPANLAGKPLNPKTIITKMRDTLSSQNTKAAQQADLNIWEMENPLYASNELDSCTTCGACMEECPANIEHVQIIMDLKRYKALTLGDLPPAAADAVNKIKTQGNPWGISQDDRFKWADGLEVPVIQAGKKVDYLYYVGCAGSYDGSNQKVVKDTVALLKKAGVSFAVLGKTEKCNGDPIRRFGDEYSFYEIAIQNISTLRQFEFTKVVTHCPHCLHTIGKEYAKFEEGSFETIHHTELLAELLKQGHLKPQKSLNEELTFHDPCYLGRHHGAYDAPREVLQSIPGVQLKEMETNKDKALCCGMGGGNMWYELPEGEHLAHNRLVQIGETQAPKLATSCSYCMINFNSSKGTVKETENLQVEDVASLLAKSVL
jgi:Fe-S oxidoreductase